jgi:hypothetical protein
MNFTLEQNAFGKLILSNAQGERFEGVVPVRTFPIQAPEEGISLVSLDGHEVGWLNHLSDATPQAQQMIRGALEQREFMPVIERIISVTSFSTPCTWSAQTDRGVTEFVLRGDEDIRRVGIDHSLLIADTHGIQYLVRDQFALDMASKKILDRFL